MFPFVHPPDTGGAFSVSGAPPGPPNGEPGGRQDENPDYSGLMYFGSLYLTSEAAIWSCMSATTASRKVLNSGSP